MTEIILQVSDTANDVRHYVDFGFSANELLVGKASGTYTVAGGVRFPGVPIAQGTTIESATLEVVIKTDPAPSGTVWGRWYGDDKDDGPAWSSGSNPYNHVTNTTAYTQVSKGAGTSGAVVSHDVTDIVQELLDREGWISGNAMRFAAKTDAGTNGLVVFYDYSSDPTKSAKLIINYTPVVEEGRFFPFF